MKRAVLLVGFILSLFVTVPFVMVSYQLNQKLNELSLKQYQYCQLQPILGASKTSPDSTQSATMSGKVK